MLNKSPKSEFKKYIEEKEKYKQRTKRHQSVDQVATMYLSYISTLAGIREMSQTLFGL